MVVIWVKDFIVASSNYGIEIFENTGTLFYNYDNSGEDLSKAGPF